MRRTEPVKIGEMIGDFFSSNPKLARKIAEVRAVEIFKQSLDNNLADYIMRVNVSYGKMYVQVSSSVIRHEIFMRRSSIMEKINKELNEEIISTIIIK
ncbi:MAG: DUF721 domain-containing protein [Rikenellaceae bacterium]|nr:DUF721 domain-containing protein [Rikenellaceae bacterium]